MQRYDTTVTRHDAPAPPETHLLALTDLLTDPQVNPRTSLSAQAVENYRTLYQEAEDGALPLPPPEVFLVGTTYIVADGHHRLEAAKKAGLRHLPCLVTVGTRAEAFLRAIQANATQGVPFTYHDRDRIVMRLLEDAHTQDLSLRQIAALAGCSHNFVHQRRRQLLARRTVEQALDPTATTLSQTIEKTVSPNDKTPKSSEIMERQRLATFLGMTPTVVRQGEREIGSLKRRLIALVEAGKPLAEAATGVRQHVERAIALRKSSAPRTSPHAPPPTPEAVPSAAPPDPSPTASAWGQQVRDGLLVPLGLVAGVAAVELPPVDTALCAALIAAPTLLAAASAEDVQQALAMALRGAITDLERQRVALTPARRA